MGGVLEAILADRLRQSGRPTLGGLTRVAQERGIIRLGTKVGALCSLMLYLRNHVHPTVDSARKEFFIDINVAKGCKVALDLALGEMLQAPGQKVGSTVTGP